MDQAGAEHSGHPCYTCRRRRVACDRTRPVCRKCRDSGKQCLGYKKPLKWVHGVASRGNMKGLTFDDLAARQPNCSASIGGAGFNVTDPSHHRFYPAAAGRCPVVQHQFNPLSDKGESSYERCGTRQPNGKDYCQDGEGWMSQSEPAHKQDGSLGQAPLLIRQALIDPIFQDLSRLARYYLSYYDARFCRLMVLCEIPHQNPYRRFIPFARSSPALSSAISAVAACHYMHSCVSSSFQVTSGCFTSSPRSSQSPQLEFVGPPSPEARPIYQHVLMFKHRALRQLNETLSDPGKQWDETVIACILLLITLDMLESGQGDWKAHVQGAKELIKRRLGRQVGGMDLDNQSFLLPTLNGNLDTFLTGIFVMLDIMGSTFAPSGTWSEPLYSQLIMSPALLSQIEELMFIGCPAYLLFRILYTTSLRHARPSTCQWTSKPAFADAASTSLTASIAPRTTWQAHLTSIIAYIDAFDPNAWALGMQPKVPSSALAGTPVFSPSFSSSMPFITEQSFSSQTLASLFHLASVYKIAVALYAIRVLLHPPPYDESFAPKVTALLTHVSCIPLGSELFKCIVWPVFIAGTECRDPEQREWIQNVLLNLWNQCLSVNIKVAARALEVLWERDAPNADEIGDNGHNQGERDWIQFLDQSNISWLFI